MAQKDPVVASKWALEPESWFVASNSVRASCVVFEANNEREEMILSEHTDIIALQRMVSFISQNNQHSDSKCM